MVKGGTSETDIFDGLGAKCGYILLEKLNSSVNYLGRDWENKITELIKSEDLAKYDAMVVVRIHAREGPLSCGKAEL